MKEQHDALVARAREFKEFVVNFEGPEQGGWVAKIEEILADLDSMANEVVAE